MVFTADLAERKAVMLARSDGIVILAGGLGTLDEATEILEQKKHGLLTDGHPNAALMEKMGLKPTAPR